MDAMSPQRKPSPEEVHELVLQMLAQTDELSAQVARVRGQSARILMAVASMSTASTSATASTSETASVSATASAPIAPGPGPAARAGPKLQPGGNVAAWGTAVGAFSKACPGPPAVPPFKAPPATLQGSRWSSTSPTSPTSPPLAGWAQPAPEVWDGILALPPVPPSPPPEEQDDLVWRDPAALLASVREPRHQRGWRTKMWAMGEMRSVPNAWGGGVDAQPYCCVCDSAIKGFEDDHWKSNKHVKQVRYCFESPLWYAAAVLPRFITATPMLNFPKEKPSW